MAAKILRKHVLKRSGEDDVLLAIISQDASLPVARDGENDGVFQWDGTEWVLIYPLLGTNLIYDTVTWRDRIYIVDGRNPMLRYDVADEEFCVLDAPPVVQYLTVFQERLIGAGDSRTAAEVATDGGVWPVDSNRDRVLFCEALDDSRWSANNFIDAKTGTGEVVSGLGVNSITSSERGAQTQLVVFKPSATLINDGVLGSAEQRLSIVSDVLGCPGYQTIVNTPFGLVFTARQTVCLMDTSGKEPTQIGFPIWTEINAIPEDPDVYVSLKAKSAAYFHDNAYKLSIAAALSTTNDREWWLDLRPVVFPQEQSWFGPHIGDKILQYEFYRGELIGAECNSVRVWQLDQEGLFNSMLDTENGRESIMTWARFRADKMTEQKLDAYGYAGNCAAGVALTETVDYDQGTASDSQTFTTPATLSLSKPSYNVTRPLKRPAHDVQVSISHSAESDMEVHSLYVRAKLRRRQSEKQSGSTQS